MTSLYELLLAAGLPQDGRGDVPVARLTACSSEASEQAVFVALRGHKTDGHVHVMDAYRRGARLFLCERAVSLPADARIFLTENGRKTSADMLSCLYGHPQKQLSFLGVTGTKGKTTVAHAAWEALRLFDHPCALVGTTGLFFDGCAVPTRNTTPDLFFLYPYLSACAERGVRTVILEVSSQALADGRIDTLPIDTAVFTSFGRDHIGQDEHADEGAYLRAKQRLFCDFSPRYAVLNADDPVCRQTPTGDARRVLCSLGGSGDVSARLVCTSPAGTWLRLEGDLLHLCTPGELFARNALLAAAAIAPIVGHSYREIMRRMQRLRVPGRFEVLELRGRHAVVDYAHNAMSFRAVAQECRRLFQGRLIAVFGSVGGRALARRTELAKAADELFDLSVLTSDDTVGVASERICAEMQSAFLHKERVLVYPDRAEAIREAFSRSAVGDTLLLLGKGDEPYPCAGAGGAVLTDVGVLMQIFSQDEAKKSLDK